VLHRGKPGKDEREQADTGGLRIGDADRDLVASLLTRHTAEGRLTDDELEDRIGVLYAAQTRAQARSVLADLPPLTASGTVLPDWLRAPATAGALPPGQISTQTRSPSASAAAVLPTDEEMTRAYEAWRAKKAKVSGDKAAHKRAEAGDDKKETFLAFRKLMISRAEEKSARAKLDQLRKRRPDWTESPASDSTGNVPV
jgi:hypothetical protein